MRRLAALFLFAFLFTAVSFAQGGPEADALIDALYAKNVNGILAHLPPEFAKLYESLSPIEKAQLASQLPIVNAVAHEVKITRGSGSGAVLVLEPAKPDPSIDGPAEIFVDKRLTDGSETMLRVRIEFTERGEHQSKTATLNLRYVDGEWRLYEVQAEGRALKLDDPMFLGGFRHNRGAAREASAVGSMRTFNTAIVTYEATFPEIGAPHSLEQLGVGGRCEQPSVDHACLVDDSLATPPFEKGGYRYTYHRTGQDTYTITGRPLTYGDETKRSFFTDESGIIRVTTEDRDATVADPPLQ